MKRILCLSALIVFAAAVFTPKLDAKAMRIVSLAPSTTEILFALGLDEEIVGVSQFCDYPSKALLKSRVGTMSEPNIELISALKPDIVFCTGLEQAPVVAKMKRLNMNVFVSDPASIAELLGSIRQMGDITGRGKEAAALTERMLDEIESVQADVRLVPYTKRPKVFFEIWHNPLMTVGPGSIIDDLITIAGGINIAHDLGSQYGNFSPEELIRRNPDYIFMGYMYKTRATPLFENRMGWKDVSAVRNNRIYNDIDPDILLRPGPRIIEALKEVHARLYER